MPNYMRKNNRSVSSIIISAQDLTEYIFTITNNEKQFGKIMRYTLSSELRNCCIKIMENAHIAFSIRPKHKKDYKEYVKYQQKVYKNLVKLNSLIILSLSVASVKNKEQLAILFNAALDDYMRWVKTSKRVYKNLPSEKTYMKRVEKQKRKNAQTMRLRAAYKTMEKDENGFIILKRK